MKDIETKYHTLEGTLRHNAKTLLLSIEAQNVSDTYEFFLVFYKWLILDNLFIGASLDADKKSFEKHNIQEFQFFFMEHNDDWEAIMPSDKIIKMFFWQVLNYGFHKHIFHIKKLHPEIFNKSVH